MPPKRDIWTNEAEQLLIDLVKERTILWDVTQNNYRRNDLKEIQWEEISQRMGAPYTTEHLKKRWNNMRGTFLDNDRKVRDSKRSGSGVEEIFKPRWPLYTKLQFLKKTMSSAQSISNLSPYVPIVPHLSPQSQSQNEKDCQDSSDSVRSLNVLSLEIPCDTEDTAMQIYATSETLTSIPEDSHIYTESSQNSSESQEVVPSHNTSSMSESSSIPLSTSQPLLIKTPENPASAHVVSGRKHTGDEPLHTKRRACKKQKSGLSMEEAVDAIKQMASQPILLPQSSDRSAQDAVDHFAAYVGAKLRETSPQRRKLLEQEIMKVLFTVS